MAEKKRRGDVSMGIKLKLGRRKLVSLALLLLLITMAILVFTWILQPSERLELTEPEFPVGKTLTFATDGLRYSRLIIRDSSIGGDVNIAGTDGKEIYIETLILRNIQGFELIIADKVDVHTLILRNIQADGVDLDPILKPVLEFTVYGYGTEPLIEVSGHVVDALEITATASDGYIKELIIESVNAKGDFNLGVLYIGTLIVENALIGEDGSLATADLDINADVEVFTMENVIETIVQVT